MTHSLVKTFALVLSMHCTWQQTCRIDEEMSHPIWNVGVVEEVLLGLLWTLLALFLCQGCMYVQVPANNTLYKFCSVQTACYNRRRPTYWAVLIDAGGVQWFKYWGVVIHVLHLYSYGNGLFCQGMIWFEGCITSHLCHTHTHTHQQSKES